MRRKEVWWVNFDPSIGEEIKPGQSIITIGHGMQALDRIQSQPLAGASHVGQSNMSDVLRCTELDGEVLHRSEIILPPIRKRIVSRFFRVEGVDDREIRAVRTGFDLHRGIVGPSEAFNERGYN